MRRPVSGDPVSESICAKCNGGQVDFRCAACKAEFENDTTKYAAKANHPLVASGQARQKACPLSNRAFDPEGSTKVRGVQVAFCCHGCRSRVTQADADK